MTLQVAAYVVGAIIITTILEGIMIPFLTKLKIEQTERDDGPRMHKRKQGTPTMGGLVFILSTLLVTIFLLVTHKIDLSNELMIVMFVFIS